MDLLIIFLRTVFIYFIIFAILRIMGKREIGKLSIFDLIISVMIAEIAVFVIEDPHKSLMSGLLPMFVLVAIQIGMSFIQLKNQNWRTLLEGKPSILITNGRIDDLEMKRQRYNLDDLLQQLREKDIVSVNEVSYAILENSGKLSVFKKAGMTEPAFFPLPLVMDGKVQNEHLIKIEKSLEWLVQQLEDLGVRELNSVFYCAIEQSEPIRLVVQMKSCAQKLSQAAPTE
jgi:uncharacterized membrane protein YcaP (DUF421 family)